LTPLDIVFTCSITLLTCSIIICLYAYITKTNYTVIDTKRLIENFGKVSKNKMETMKNITIALAGMAKYNSDQNNNKVRYLKIGQLSLVIGLILNLVFIIGLIIIMR